MKKTGLIPEIKYSYSRVDEIPEQPKKDCVYIIGDLPWLLLFKCPCGCRATIQLNLLIEDDPCWRFTIYRNRISIYPSVWRIKGCKSHFWIKNGKVKDAKVYWSDYSLLAIIYTFFDSYFHR
jgi:hypothetical protein